MNPSAKLLLLILASVMFAVLSWPIIHQAKQMYKNTKIRWEENEGDAKKLSQLLEQIQDQQNSTKGKRIGE